MQLKFVLLFLFVSCGHVFYQPSAKIYTSPDKYNIDYEEREYLSYDKTKIKVWILKTKNKQKKGTILQFHGNAENRSTHFFQLAWLVEKGFDIIVPDYRGYGGSSGVPSREGIFHDARIMIEKAYEYYQQNNNKTFIVFGQSLGGNIALRAAYDYQNIIDVLVLDSTFISYREIAFDKLKNNWITFLFSPLAYISVDDEFSAKEVVAKIQIPTIVMHGEKDVIVPYKFGKETYAKLNSKKIFVSYPMMNHLQAFTLEENRNRFFEVLLNLNQHKARQK